MIGTFQSGTPSHSRICREVRPRSVSTSFGATRLNRYLSATEFKTLVNQGKLSASVPSMSKMTSLYFTAAPLAPARKRRSP